ncbi:DUF3842 family protein [Clostridium culturomicium]|uniref:DUF3842 family protein n=1 Tax=Clostridium culturomicium TaxID=1499683 RepID=UPI0038575DF0
MKIVVIDGQGGRIGRGVIEQLKSLNLEADIFAIGTNGIATSTMIKAGADYAATGENPVIVNSRNADIIIGPIGIVIADSLLGEITPAMAVAVGQSRAEKILLPINKCNNRIVGVGEINVSEIIGMAIERVREILTIK